MALGYSLLNESQAVSSPVRRATFAAAAFGALLGATVTTLVIVIIVEPGTGPYYPGVPIDLAITASDADVDIVKGSYATWGAGGFLGSNASHNVARFFSENAVFGFGANVDEQLYSVYHDRSGVLEFVHKLLALKYLHFEPSVFKGPAGTVVANIYYDNVLIPTGAALSSQIDFMEFHMHGGRISKAKIYWGNQPQLAKLWASGTIGPVTQMIQARGSGKFSGPNAREAAEIFFAPDMLLDATAEVEGTDGFKSYHGIDGMLYWVEFLAAFNFHEYTPVLFAGPRRHTVMVQASYGVTYKPTGKSAPTTVSDVLLFEVANGRISYGKIFWGSPSMFGTLMVQ